MGNEQGRPLTEEEKRLQSIKTMDAEMRQKLGGLTPKYNMKIVIRGERNTGKTVLWKRLQQLPFEEAYVPTPEIQVGTISWNYKTTDELIKVEVWDVVDQGNQIFVILLTFQGKKRQDGKLKLNNSTEEEEDDEEAMSNVPSPESKSGSYTVSKLDASTVNVYTNTNAVIIMVDPTKKWTFEYTEKELPKIPKDIDVLLLVNYMDMAEYRIVEKSEVISLISDHSDRSIHFVEASLKNNYGMKEIVSFFNIPFLRLKRQYLQQQLVQNQRDIENAINELHILNEEQNYQNYAQALEELKKSKKKSSILNLASPTAVLASQGPTRSQEAPAALAQPATLTKQDSQGSIPQQSSVEVPSVSPWRRMSLGNRKDVPPSAEPQSATPASPPPVTKQDSKGPPPVTKQDSKGSIPTLTKQDSKASIPQPASKPEAQPAPAKAGNFFSRLFKSSSNLQEDKQKPEDDLKKLAMEARTAPKEATNIDEFVPGELDNQFFGEDDSPRGKNSKDTKKQPAKPAPKPVEDDSDEDTGNPLVAADIEEVEETKITRPAKTQTKPSPKQAAKPSQTPKIAPKPAPDSDDDAPNPFVTPDTEEPSPIKSVKNPSRAKPPSRPVVQIQDEEPKQEPPKKKAAPKKPVVDDDDESPNPLVAADELPDDEPAPPKRPTVRKAKAAKPAPAKPEPAKQEITPVKQEPVKQESPKVEPTVESKPEVKTKATSPAKQPEPTPTKQEPSPKQTKTKTQTKKAAPVVTPDEDDDKPNPLVVADVEEELPSKPAPRLKSKPKKQSAVSPQKTVSAPIVTASVEVTVPTTSASSESVSVPVKKEEEKPVVVSEPAHVEPEVTPSVVEEMPTLVKEEPKPVEPAVVTEEAKPVEVVLEEPVLQLEAAPVQEEPKQVETPLKEEPEQESTPKIDMEDEFFMIDNRSQGSRKSDSTPSQVQSVDEFIPEATAEDDFFAKDDEEPAVPADTAFNQNSDDEEDLSKSRIEVTKQPHVSDVDSLKDDEEERYQVQRITAPTQGKDSEEDEPSKVVPRNKFGSSVDFSGRESAEIEVQQPKTIKVTLVAQEEDSEKATGESDEPVEEVYSGQEQPVEVEQEEEEVQPEEDAEEEEEEEEDVEEIQDAPQEEDPWAKLGISSASQATESDPWAAFGSQSVISTAGSDDPWAQLGVSTTSNADPFAALEQLPQEQPASKSKKTSSKSTSKSPASTTSKTSKTKTQPSKPAKKVQQEEEEEEEDIWNTNPKKTSAFDAGSDDDDDIWNTTQKWEDDEPAEEASTSQEKPKKKKSTSSSGSSKKGSSSSKSKKSGEETSKRKHKTKKSDQ